MASSSRASRMKALGRLSCSARRLTWERGVCGTVLTIAGDAGQFVGQRPVDHHATRAGTLIRVQASQQTVPLPGV